MNSLLTLYYKEFSENNKLMNFVSYGDEGYELLQKHQTKEKKAHDQVPKEEKKEQKKLDKQRLSKLAVPKDKWKVGKKLLEL